MRFASSSGDLLAVARSLAWFSSIEFGRRCSDGDYKGRMLREAASQAFFQAAQTSRSADEALAVAKAAGSAGRFFDAERKAACEKALRLVTAGTTSGPGR